MILCIGSTALPETLDLARIGAELGYDALLCPPPYYFRAAQLEGLAALFRTVLDAAQVPVLLYHFPRIIGVPISDELLDAIGPHEMLVGVKDSSGDPAEMQRLLPRFVDGAYFVGSDRLVQSCVEKGGRGSITAAASVAPALVKAVQEKKAPQEKLDRVRALLEEFGLGPAVKAILRNHGFGDYAARPPMLPLTPQRERELLRQLPRVLD
jgi:4-hydroxy-tetrahydrodipicolinate synthase